MSKINISKKIDVGDRVILTTDSLDPSPQNPYFKSNFSCEGLVLDIPRKDLVVVQWSNGLANSYHMKDLSVSESYSEETRSIVIVNSDIKIGDHVIVKKGKRMYVQGDYLHDSDGFVYIKISEDIDKKKFFSRNIKK